MGVAIDVAITATADRVQELNCAAARSRSLVLAEESRKTCNAFPLGLDKRRLNVTVSAKKKNN